MTSFVDSFFVIMLLYIMLTLLYSKKHSYNSCSTIGMQRFFYVNVFVLICGLKCSPPYVRKLCIVYTVSFERLICILIIIQFLCDAISID